MKKTPSYLNLNDEIITKPEEIAETFNKYFVNIGPELANKIDESNKLSFASYQQSTIKTNFRIKLIDMAVIREIINKLKPKTSFGLDKDNHALNK
jgi:hypothetical protein